MSTNPRATAEDFLRFKKIIASRIDLENGNGLEIGPFDRPFFTKDETKVAYLDYKSTEQARAYAAQVPGHYPEWVVDVDYVVPASGSWDMVPDRGFDWVLSSHALEHSPNLIGFLQTMSRKLRPGGLIISMLPDKRRTFEAMRPLSTIGKVFEDYMLNASKPSVQSVIDQMFYGKNLDIDGAERAYHLAGDYIVEGADIKRCLELAELSRKQYIDTHNYVFTSASFETIIRQICLSGVIDLHPMMHLPTLDHEMTFLNILQVKD